MVTTFLLLLALRLPPAPTHYVTDNAGVLPADRAAALEKKLYDFDALTTNQVIVYIDRHVPPGATMEEMATTAMNTWGVGQKGKNNGVILFVFIEDRKYRLEVGDGLTLRLTDERAQDITATMKPFLRRAEYASAVEVGVNEILAATRLAAAPAPLASPPPDAPRQWSAGTIVFLLLALIVLGGAAAALVARVAVAFFRNSRQRPSTGASGSDDAVWVDTASGANGGGGSSFPSASSHSAFDGGGGSAEGHGASDSW